MNWVATGNSCPVMQGQGVRAESEAMVGWGLGRAPAWQMEGSELEPGKQLVVGSRGLRPRAPRFHTGLIVSHLPSDPTGT